LGQNNAGKWTLRARVKNPCPNHYQTQKPWKYQNRNFWGL